MSTYDVMKDSGIDWIGMIPNHWNTIKIKHTSWLKGRIGWQGLKSDEYKDEGPYLITGTDFVNGRINWESCVHITEERFEEAPEIHIKENDLLITKDGTIGKVAIAKDCPQKVSLNSGVLLIRNTKQFKYIDKYLYYILLSDQFWTWYEMSQTGNSTIRHLYQEQFYNFSFTYPPLPEQCKLSEYLDLACSDIDTAIAEAKASIEDYKLLKQSIITQAVTKGLNPTVPMKDSGIEWIGRIPSHWKIERLKFIANSFDKGNGITKEDVDLNGDISCVRYGEIYSKYDNSFVNCYSKTNRDKIPVCKYFTHGDILFAGTGELVEEIGKNIVYLGNEQCLAGGDIIILKHSQNPVFLNYALNSHYAQSQKSCNKAKLKVVHISTSNIQNLYIAYPNIDEQTEIATYLDTKCTNIDGLITEKEAMITDLEAYKKSLIFEVVTGKRKVC